MASLPPEFQKILVGFLDREGSFSRQCCRICPPPNCNVKANREAKITNGLHSPKILGRFRTDFSTERVPPAGNAAGLIQDSCSIAAGLLQDGLLQDSCMIAAGLLSRIRGGLLQDGCRIPARWIPARFLPDCCRIPWRIPAGFLQDCCRLAAGFPQVCCRISAGLLQDAGFLQGSCRIPG